MVNNTKLNYFIHVSSYLVSNIKPSPQENKAIQNLSNCLFRSLSYEAPHSVIKDTMCRQTAPQPTPM